MSVPGFGSVVGTGGLSQGKLMLPGEGAMARREGKEMGRGLGGPGWRNWCRDSRSHEE